MNPHIYGHLHFDKATKAMQRRIVFSTHDGITVGYL
jgi:hypothetical protein